MKNKAITFKMSSDDKHREVYTTTSSSVSADDTTISTITYNYAVLLHIQQSIATSAELWPQ